MCKTKKIFCNNCKQKTNHKLIGQHDNTHEVFHDEAQRYVDSFWEDVYSMLACLGCDTCVMECRFTESGMKDLDGDQIFDYTYFPERINTDSIRAVKRFLHIKSKLNKVYREIIDAYNSGIGIVCAMGIRALLEGICVNEGIGDSEARGLKGKLNKLKELSHIPESIYGALMSMKFIGDSAAHRLETGKNEELSLSIDILEALLSHLYETKFELQVKADELKTLS